MSPHHRFNRLTTVETAPATSVAVAVAFPAISVAIAVLLATSVAVAARSVELATNVAFCAAPAYHQQQSIHVMTRG